MKQAGLFATITSALRSMLGKAQMAPLPLTIGDKLYHQVLQASRAPTLYADFGVEDSIDGRFDALCLMQSLVMRRMTGQGSELSDTAQDMFDAMFQDMDLTLREMGVGDMGVGKRVKFMSEAFMGRLTSYDDALTANDVTALEQALYRNIYREGAVAGDQAKLAEAVLQIVMRLDALDNQQFLTGELPDDLLQIQN